jgi:hypothetical protein
LHRQALPPALLTSTLQNFFGFAICVGFALRKHLTAALPPTVFDNRLRDAVLATAQPPKAL